MAPSTQGTVWLFSQPHGILPLMRNPLKAALLTLLVSMFAFALVAAQSPSAAVPEYTDDGQMKLPENYRQWVYLTTGFDMSYNPGQMSMDHHMFDNVFVNPEAYQSFVQNGTWPDKTMMVLEVRKAEGKGSINQKGNFQGLKSWDWKST